jgi:hypothetical protein
LYHHGVRCPSENAGNDTANAFVVESDGTYYRVTCSPYGD